MLVSPAEHHPLLSNLGPVSSEVEAYGSDFLFLTKHGLVGVQRKALPDLVASLRDARLQRELVQAEKLEHFVLVAEGEWSDKLRISRAEYNGVMLSLQSYGVWTMTTRDTVETAELLRQMEGYFDKDSHDSLLRKPKSKVPPELHILQHFDGISLTRAKAIYDRFGRVPLCWACSEQEMLSVDGIGRITVDKMKKQLGEFADD